jgi:predicted alpha-1,2-mannosidase
VKLRAALVSAVAALAAFVVPTHAAPGSEDLTGLVNPLAGSLGAGFVQVAAGAPFGMATPGPATTTPAGDDPVNYIGYAYQDPMIRGFAVNHFSGAGVHIGGELPFMPTTGAIPADDPTQFASPFEHATEVARPGYYAVTLDRYQVRAELTATPRVAVERYTFPATTQANVLLDLARDNDGMQTSTMRFTGDRTVTGSVTGTIDGRRFTLFFTARFDRPFVSTGVFTPTTGGYVTFDTTSNPTVGVRIGLSWTSAQNATDNLDAEAPDGTSFDTVRVRAHGAWNDALHAIDVSGGFGRQRRTFYTALYHALLLPVVFDDDNGDYLGFDGAVHRVDPGHHHYTDLSLWDTFRTQVPLLALVVPKVAHDIGISLLDDADQSGGTVPQWVYANVDTGTMGGDSGTPALAMLVADGALSGKDARRAWQAVLHQATTLPPVSARGHLDDYLAKGYVPYEDSGNAAPLTLEYAVDDAAVAALARGFGTSAQVASFTARSQSWRNLFDTSAPQPVMRPRNADGSWADPTDLGVTRTYNPMLQDGWQEGTGYQWTWLVPQNPPALADAMGGTAAAVQRLDQFFGTPASSEVVPAVPLAQDQAGLFGVYYAGNQYAPGNETDLQAPWLYDFFGVPSSTQRVVHAEAQLFTDNPYGLPGNDDAGTMSSWYVLAAIGLYQVTPGLDAWVLSSPLFDTVHLRGGTDLVADGAGPTAQYVAAARLGNRVLDRDWVGTDELRKARALTYTLATTPTGWAAGSTPPVVG